MASRLTYWGELVVTVDENDAVCAVLQPGEMSLHHGQVFHSSHKNSSTYRRIGLAIRYITPNVKQTTNDKMNAKLVAGRDSFGHFNFIDQPKDVLHPDDIELLNKNIELSKKSLFAGTK